MRYFIKGSLTCSSIYVYLSEVKHEFLKFHISQQFIMNILVYVKHSVESDFVKCKGMKYLNKVINMLTE